MSAILLTTASACLPSGRAFVQLHSSWLMRLSAGDGESHDLCTYVDVHHMRVTKVTGILTKWGTM